MPYSSTSRHDKNHDSSRLSRACLETSAREESILKHAKTCRKVTHLYWEVLTVNFVDNP
jgi:hypothetical protein